MDDTNKRRCLKEYLLFVSSTKHLECIVVLISHHFMFKTLFA